MRNEAEPNESIDDVNVIPVPEPVPEIFSKLHDLQRLEEQHRKLALKKYLQRKDKDAP